MKSLFVLFLALGVTTSAFASGFRCYEEDGYTVYLKNKSAPESRTPELLRVRYDGELLLERTEKQITKSNRNNVVRYTVRGNKDVGFGKATLQVHFKEGRETLERGESVDGQLILYTNSTGDREVHQMECVRWLAN